MLFDGLISIIKDGLTHGCSVTLFNTLRTEETFNIFNEKCLESSIECSKEIYYNPPYKHFPHVLIPNYCIFYKMEFKLI